MPVTKDPEGQRVCSEHGPIEGDNARPRTSKRTGRPIVPDCMGCRRVAACRPRPERRVKAKPVAEMASWVDEYEYLLSWGMQPSEARAKLGVSAIFMAQAYRVVGRAAG